ncbi:MAG: glycosyltransferase family 4 protein, partial [Syntrophomonadaceae bacterium]|nr:glycosyltransferase family 4 protein [Syntrophomonadaceae bacterium]
FMRNEIISLFEVGSKQVTVIPNGVNLNPYVDDRGAADWDLSQYGVEPDDQIIFYIGRLVPEKGVEVLIGAFARVANERPRAKLVIGGRGSQTGHLKTMAAELGLTDRIIFTGYISDEARDRLYCRADMAVFPSMYEPFGIVALEAMASGVPVVVSDVGGLSEIVSHGETGLKVARGDEQDLAQAMLLITSDYQGANRMRLKAVQMIEERYSWDRVADMTSQVYYRVSSRTEKNEVLI